jgi:hypothetical protein
MKRGNLYMTVGALAAAILCVVAVVAWRLDVRRHALPAAHSLIAYDRSAATLCGCDALVARAKKELESEDLGQGSTLTIILSGDESTADEPVLLGTYAVPTIRKAMEGRHTLGDKQKLILDDVRSRCQQKAQTQRSPIFLTIRRGLERLHAAGCDGRVECHLVALTDLEERSERHIRQFLDRQPRTDRKVSGALGEGQLPAPLDNNGVAVFIVGVSNTIGRSNTTSGQTHALTITRDSGRADRIKEVWERLFANTQRLFFDPLCPTN